MTERRVLVIEDDPAVRIVVGDILKSRGARVFLARDGEEGLTLLKREPADILFTDLRLPGGDGVGVIEEAGWICPRLATVIITGYPSFATSVAALQLGVCDYVTKPITHQKIDSALARAVSYLSRHERSEKTPPRNRPESDRRSPWDIIAASPAMQKVLRLAEQTAKTDASVLILGEKGVGKSLIAKRVHEQSDRSNGPFVQLSCHATREDRLESLLGEDLLVEQIVAEQHEVDLLDRARGGTLFLDRVDELPSWAHAKLLHSHDRRGGTPTDVRILASACCDLDAAVREGRFSREFYYFINVVTIHVPPLRHRREDIRPLAESLLKKSKRLLGRFTAGTTYRFPDQAWDYLTNHPWYGNAAELANIIERAVLSAEGGEIRAATIAELIRQNHVPGTGVETITVPLDGDLKNIQRHIVRQVIARCHGNKTAAARSLGLHRKAIYRLLQDNGSATTVDGQSPQHSLPAVAG